MAVTRKDKCRAQILLMRLADRHALPCRVPRRTTSSNILRCPRTRSHDVQAEPRRTQSPRSRAKKVRSYARLPEPCVEVLRSSRRAATVRRAQGLRIAELCG